MARKPNGKLGTGKRVWTDEHYVRVYQLAREGATDAAIAKALGVAMGTFLAWKKAHPALVAALAAARDPHYAPATFLEYVHGRLPLELRRLWDAISRCDNGENAYRRVTALLDGRPEYVRQHLFLYAYVASNFNASEACRRLCLSRRTLQDWLDFSPGFADLMDEIQWHKKNFFEGALMARVAAGDTAAVIFANRTQNRDRGYGDKVEIDGAIDHRHTVSLDELDLPLEARKALLAALRARGTPPALEAEVVG